MIDFLSDFLQHFFPDLPELPAWLQVVIGLYLLALFVKIVIAFCDRR